MRCKLAAWGALCVLCGAPRTLRRFDWLHRRRDGVWVLTVVRYPHAVCTGSCVVGTYMGLARPEKVTGHVQTFSPNDLENVGVRNGATRPFLCSPPTATRTPGWRCSSRPPLLCSRGLTLLRFLGSLGVSLPRLACPLQNNSVGRAWQTGKPVVPPVLPCLSRCCLSIDISERAERHQSKRLDRVSGAALPTASL